MDVGSLNMAIEDKFIILQLNVENDMLPTGNTLDNFSYILSSFSHNHQIVCDFRNVNHITRDLIEFVEDFEFYNSQVLINEEHKDFFQEYVNPNIPLLTVDKFITKFNEQQLDLTIFADEHSRDVNFKEYNEVLNNFSSKYKGLPTKEEFNLFNTRDGLDIERKPYYKDFDNYLSFCNSSNTGIHLGDDIIFGRRYLNDFIKTNRQKSLLSQYCIRPNIGGGFEINSYQSNTFNNIETKGQLIQGRPYVTTAFNYHQQAIFDFQRLLSNPKIKESEIQHFLEKHPFFLENLGYKSIRPNIILERENGQSLKPDFMLEPLGGEWWDILDLKLPNKKIIISSSKDRYRFSAGVMELQAQLREYATYFEDKKYAKRIEDKYGIKCYKPKMIGIIGDDFSGNDDRQVRRLMSTYSDMKIVPFNELYRISNERLSI